MPRTRAVTPCVRDLVPGDGLVPEVDSRFRVGRPHVRFAAPVPLEPGWYEVDLAIRSADRFTVRKRLELTFDSGDANPRPAGREAFSWNQAFAERFMLKLTRPAAGVRLDLWHAEGVLSVEAFNLRALRGKAVVAKAVREKVRLTRAYRCFGPALMRGGRLLWRGKFAEFGAKLVKGLTDSRAMQLGTVEIAEVNGAWWRRHALPTEEAEAVRLRVDAMPEPPPFTVILPVDNHRLDPARLSAHSVRRQLYPHWQLIIAAAGDDELQPHLERLLGNDPRVRIVRVPRWAGRKVALGRAVSEAECGRVLLLPPGVELAEHALFHAALAAKAEPEREYLGLRIAPEFGRMADANATPATVWLLDPRRLSDKPPHDISAERLATWATAAAAPEQLTRLEPILAHPIDDRPLLERTRVGKAPVIPGKTLYLGADVRGIGGYDHLTFALLKGLPSAGAELRRHPVSLVRSDLVPPALLPPVVPRKAGEAQLVAGPPFLVPRFGLDSRSAVFTMWETDRLDPEWVPQLNKAGVIIVPSRWQADCFRADGITTPLEVAPLGFDPLVYAPTNTFPEVCTFGTAGALTAGGVRKNAQWVIDQFRQAFEGVPDVRLRVKVSPGSPGVETYDDPRIDVIRAVLPHGELAEWYRSLTAYVNGSFGEGFGLHLIEAMACGRALVTPNHTGLTAFFDPDIGYPVAHRLVPVRNEIYRGHWAEPDEASMREQLRAAYADPARARRLGELSAARAKSFTWKAAGQQLVRVLRKHGYLDG